MAVLYVAGHVDDGRNAEAVRRLTGLSFAYPGVGAERRAHLAASESIEEARRRAREMGREILILATCLRVELAWPGGPDQAPEVVKDLFGDPSLAGLGTIRRGEEAFLHLCRIAAGLRSPVVGEPEVLTQFRQAVAKSRLEPGEGALSPFLEAAIGVARTTRRAMTPAPPGSLASLAAREAVESRRVAILGAGAMARVAAEHLSDVEVSVFARRNGHVAGLPPRPWEQVPHALATYPAVISTVPGPESFPSPMVQAALRSREDPLLLVDLGMPPGFPPPFDGQLVRYLGVDEIASSLSQDVPPEIESRLATEASRAWRRLTAPPRTGAVIGALVDRAEHAADEEVQRFANRLAAADDPDAVLRQLARTVARRILHQPISYLGSVAGSNETRVLAAAFGIDDD